jgi:ribonuclease Z
VTDTASPPAGRPQPPERSDRALLVLGTAAQTPTLDRHHNAAVLRWDDELILFDPGEGAQTQLERGGAKPARIDRICLTHLHGDHCLGLPGVIERRSNDDVDRPLHLHYPAASEPHLLKLLDATEDTGRVDLRLHPVHEDGPVETDGPYRLLAMALDHTVPTVGWRLEEPDGVHLLSERLDELGVQGAAVGRLRREGEVTVGERRVRLVDVAVPRPGQVVAWVMDTRVCVAATLLARGADLLVCEATYRGGEEDLAEAHGHLSAAQAARIAHDARARRLVLTHYSRRHPDAAVFGDDARATLAALDPPLPDVVAAEDLTWVEVPVRERPTR